MKLIVGLGNPGEKYAKTRHNIGFMVVDELIRGQVSSPQINNKLSSIIYKIDGDLIIKPERFMNASGKAVRDILGFYKIHLGKLLVINDDLDLEFGEIKHQFGRTSAGHKGVQSVIDYLGTDEFFRLRVGVGKPSHPAQTEEWVLQEFTREEKEKLGVALGRAKEVALNWLAEK